jgi:hypothetical protein
MRRDRRHASNGALPMPITKADVLAVLNDPVLNRISFSVGAIVVNAEAFRIVARYIEAGDVKVVPGRGAVAVYDRRQNQIETPAGNPPLNFTDSAQLLHECVHAFSDINGLSGSALDDEVAGYLAQMTYSELKNPTRPILASAARLGAAGPMGRMIHAMQATMRTYNLHNDRGFGAKIGGADIFRLGQAVRAVPAYAHLNEKSTNPHAGVPVVNGNQMQALREAMTRGQRIGRKPAAPITRPMIF